jgi:DNA-binding beta-propeller fold protein YncE
VSNASTNEIYRVTIDRAGHSQTYVASVAGAERIATMVLDQARQLLFVGDVRTGAIYRVDLRRKRATPFIARSGGEVRALALRNNRLYVADARNERVFVTDVTGPSGSLRLFSAWSELRSPVGIAVSSDGGVWVADDRARKLFRFNRENERPSRVIPW